MGHFPVLWAEWNDASRDTVRCFWKGDGLLGFRGALRYYDTRCLTQLFLRVDRDAESHLHTRITTGDILGYS